jgi:hypothetical protein
MKGKCADLPLGRTGEPTALFKMLVRIDSVVRKQVEVNVEGLLIDRLRKGSVRVGFKVGFNPKVELLRPVRVGFTKTPTLPVLGGFPTLTEVVD